MDSLNSLFVQLDFLENVDTPIFVKNQLGVYVFCNSAFTDFLGIPKEKILGHTAYDIAPVQLANTYTKADIDLFDSAEKQIYTSNVLTAKNSNQTVKFTKSLIYTKDNQIGGFVGSIQQQNSVNPNFEKLNVLSPAERKVLNQLFVGKSIKAIANHLSISHHTVMGYTKSIYTKLGVHSKNEALYKAITLINLVSQ
jgi:PAS domain S-box-containing protein